MLNLTAVDLTVQDIQDYVSLIFGTQCRTCCQSYRNHWVAKRSRSECAGGLRLTSPADSLRRHGSASVQRSYNVVLFYFNNLSTNLLARPYFHIATTLSTHGLYRVISYCCFM